MKKKITLGYFISENIIQIKEKVFNDSILKTLNHKVIEILSIKQVFADIYEVVYIFESGGLTKCLTV